VRQRKTGLPVRFELTDQTRQALDEYLHLTGRKPGQFLFTGRGSLRGLTTRQYARLVGEWVASIGLDPHKFGTHSLRRTKAVLIYRRTGNLRAVQLLLSNTAYCPRTTDGSQGPLSISSAVRRDRDHQTSARQECCGDGSHPATGQLARTSARMDARGISSTLLYTQIPNILVGILAIAACRDRRASSLAPVRLKDRRWRLCLEETRRAKAYR
jgi:hypothetical protein